jgi:hypothetical protein
MQQQRRRLQQQSVHCRALQSLRGGRQGSWACLQALRSLLAALCLSGCSRMGQHLAHLVRQQQQQQQPVVLLGSPCRVPTGQQQQQ